MKYQIYLNKETSDIINEMAQIEEQKPNTFIKHLVESMIRIAMATSQATEAEAKKYGKK